MPLVPYSGESSRFAGVRSALGGAHYGRGMTDRTSKPESLAWSALRVVGCGVLGVVLGAVLGSWIGGRLGDPEGEGFIGFLLGLRIGGLVGVLAGLAWTARRRFRRPR